MWTIYETSMTDEGIFNETFFGYTNDEIAAREMVFRGYVVCDSDTLEPFSFKGE